MKSLAALLGAAGLFFRTSAKRHDAEASLAIERTLLTSVIDGMADGLVSVDSDWKFVLFNPAAERLFGPGTRAASPAEWANAYRLCRSDTATPFPPDELPLVRALRGENSDAVEMYVSRADRGVWLSVGARPLRDAAGKITGAFAIFTDVTDRRRAAAEVEAANAQLQTTVAELSRMTYEKTLLADLADTLQGCLTQDEVYGAVTRSTPRLFPANPGELFAVDPYQPHLHRVSAWGTEPAARNELVFEPDDCWAARQGRVHLANGTESGLCGHIARPAKGRHVCVPMLGQEGTIGVLHLELPGPAERVTGAPPEEEAVRTATAAAKLVSSALTSIRLRDKLRIISIRDPLTGLFNRRYMEESLTRELRRAERTKSLVGVIMLDVDHFKRTNDEHGHAAGDCVLKGLGALLAAQIRSSDLGCRYGGEEFTLILPDAGLAGTAIRAEAIRVAVEASVTRLPNGSVIKATVSQGVAAFPAHGTTPAELLGAADLALYEAKRSGRNRVERAGAVVAV